MKLVIAYAAIALLTFGYAASSPNICSPGFFSTPPECRVGKGLSAGAFWPLYWTWTAFDAGRAALGERGDG